MIMKGTIETLEKINHIETNGTAEDAIKEYLKKNDDTFGHITLKGKKQFWTATKVKKGRKTETDIKLFTET